MVDDTTTKREDSLRHFLHGFSYHVAMSVGEKDHRIRRGLHRLDEIRVEDENASVESREFDHALHRFPQEKRGQSPPPAGATNFSSERNHTTIDIPREACACLSCRRHRVRRTRGNDGTT